MPGDPARADASSARPNYAARVAAAAGGDEIVVSSLVRDLVGSAEFAFGQPREVALRGFAGLHRVYPLDRGALVT
jgi:class 3 adenylate cyclase